MLSDLGAADQHVLGEAALGAAAVDDAVVGGHRVEHHVVTDGQSGHVGADLGDLPGRFVAERGGALPRWDAADGYVEGLAQLGLLLSGRGF
ncbi:hypothetical protein GCM10009828_068110 [Actinoplanes couchii]